MRQTKLMGIRYRSIADRIERMIADGVYEPGERIASIRQLSELFDASINTIKSALHLLQDRGILNAVPRVGTYVVSRPVAYHESEYVDDLVDAVIEEYGRPPISTAVIQKMDLAVLPQEL
ncbi:MAG TPA: winged helix-turn-helix domain-containing protein, partial [Alkalispirochaeta sp.]|nr:winged helix-turn-helix domain-containing protein [Alkalispirochaeta sp.]